MATVKKRLILVLGMHRSGTSSLTRGLQVLGVSLGDNLMAPIAGINDKGFWEDNDVVELNENLLHALGRTWLTLHEISETEVALLHREGFMDRAVELIENKTENIPVFGLKDPRISRLLPFWLDVFTRCDLRVDCLLALRNPISVADSLARRDGFLRERSYQLWLAHTLEGLWHSLQVDSLRAIIDYDHYLETPKDYLQTLASTLSLSIGDERALDEYVSDFIDPDLRHSKHTVDELKRDETCTPLVLEVYEHLVELAQPAKWTSAKNALAHKIESWVQVWDRESKNLEWIDKEITGQGRSQTSQGRSRTSQGRSRTSQGRSRTSQGRSRTSQGRSRTSQGRSRTSQGRSRTSQGRTGRSVQLQIVASDKPIA
ncbi:sulfotransferase family protein [Acidihalobacter ferrooxydans]|uniref:sulfotransferase family protein n=1 Tax=Acidihalobacter ferrooxydans TaxID=1765967 RepID=UPI0018DE9CA8|nr:hypothetical protein [Acidihalobacter ferrooxydans]